MKLSDVCRVMIQAGGRGVRLQPYTQTQPKPMLPVHGKPILQRLLDELIMQGTSECHISVGYLGEVIQAFFGSKYRECQLMYIEEKSPRGTVGAAKSIPLNDKPILVVNGDLLLECDLAGLIDMHLGSGAGLTVGIQRHTVSVPFGVVKRDIQGRVLQVDEKPEFEFEVCCGLNVLSRTAVELIPDEGPYDMPCLIHNALAAGLKVDSHTLGGKCLEVGSLNAYHDLIQSGRTVVRSERPVIAGTY